MKKKELKRNQNQTEADLDGLKDGNLLELLNISPITFLYLQLLEKSLNDLALKEREDYLKRNPNDSANGFYTRTLYYATSPLSVRVPRTRSSNFFPKSLPKYQRVLPKVYEQLVESIILSSRSIESAKRSMKTLGLPINEPTIDGIVEEYANDFRQYVSRELDSDYFIIFMDAKVLHVKEDGKVKRMVMITAVGVNMEGMKEVLGCMIFEGNETIDKWREFILDLQNRGVRRVLLFVTDNFPGLTKLIRGLFPMAMHQLCIVHLIRNAKTHLKREDYRRFRREMAKIERSEDFDQAYTLFLELIEWLREKGYIHFSKELSRKAEHYVVFTKFPMEIRTRVKSTNASENLHKELEKIKQNGGGYFQSMRILEAKWGMYLRKLREGRWRRPEPRFKGALPELYRLFRSIYESGEVF